MWLEIEIDVDGETLRVTGRGSRGERPRPYSFSTDNQLDALQNFASKTGRAIRTGKPLDTAVVADAQALYGELFNADMRDVLVRLRDVATSKDGPLLIRLFLRDRSLQSIPWEALCKPGTSEGFLGTDPNLCFARGVASSEPWEPRDVNGTVRVLAIAPGSDERNLLALQEALAPSIEVGEVEWLDPIAGADISPRALFDRLRRGKTPHVVHWLGHGGMGVSGKPSLRVSDDEEGEEVWITAEALGRELSNSFCEDLRLVILEACEGAKAGVFGSAAEILVAAGADAVVAHLWPVKADVARICSTEIYRSLTGDGRSVGDIGASVAAARRTLLAHSAEAFSPILFLRGAGSVIFDFHDRRVVKPNARRKSRALPPALQSLLETPFTWVLGDHSEDPPIMKNEILSFLKENGEEGIESHSLTMLAERCILRYGEEYLMSLFQQALKDTMNTGPSPLTREIARFIGAGVHVTLLWNPHMERAIGEAHPKRNLYAIQLSIMGMLIKARVLKRAAGASVWKTEAVTPKRFNLDDEIVILRLYGGYSAEPRPIFSKPLVAEDDHIYGLFSVAGLQAPTWLEELLARIRTQPGLFVGLSTLAYQHRILLRWLYDQRQAPNDSLALMSPASDAGEADIWEAGGGLPGGGQIKSIVEDFGQLATLLETLTPGEMG